MAMTVEMRPVASIRVVDRVRVTFGDMHELVDSLRERGLVNPITIQADGTLIAGERRLRAARELDWTEIACHVWQAESVDELLAIEIEENTCRADLTLGEAERAWQRYRELIKPLIPGGRGDAVKFGPESTIYPKGSKVNEVAAQAVGYGRPTMERVQEVREAAEDETEDESVRQVAAEEYAKLQTATRGAVPALEKVRLARRQATRGAMSPGQWLKSDEPKAPPKAVNWHTRLWDVVATGQQVRKTAEELELDPDTSALATGDLTKMVELLQEQILDRQYLRKVLISIKKGRK